MEFINILKEKIEILSNILNKSNIENINLIILNIIDDLIVFSNNINENTFDVNYYNEKLNQMLSAMKDGDYYLFTDILKYELLPIIEDYAKLNKN